MKREDFARPLHWSCYTAIATLFNFDFAKTPSTVSKFAGFAQLITLYY
jgi:hypothetical protein